MDWLYLEGVDVEFLAVQQCDTLLHEIAASGSVAGGSK